MSKGKSTARGLEALAMWLNRPEGKPEPAKTNWATTPHANDNADIEDVGHVERRLSMRPTLPEIIRQVATNDVERNDAGQIIRIGKLRFSDGTQTTKMFKPGPNGQVVQYDARLPVGAMIGCTEQQERVLGGDNESDNRIYRQIYQAKAPGKPRRKPRPEVRVEMTKEGMREMLAEAIANTPVMPPVKKCPTGFPWKPGDLRYLFVGVEKGKKGETGSVGWEDISTSMVDREIWAVSIAELSERDQKVLDAASRARTYADIGVAVGQSPLYAKYNGGGRRALQAANDNLMAAMKKNAA